MKSLTLLFLAALLLIASTAFAASPPPKMRPYTGVGILMLPLDSENLYDPLPLYEEPGLSRRGSLDIGKLPRYEWIFGATPATAPLIVTGRKGEWLRVAYDDAGREAWLKPSRAVAFQSWDTFLREHVARLLPGLQKRCYQLYQHPDDTVLAQLTTGQFLKVLSVENDWAMILSDRNQLGWLRWRDEDGRLLLGLISSPRAMQP